MAPPFLFFPEYGLKPSSITMFKRILNWLNRKSYVSPVAVDATNGNMKKFLIVGLGNIGAEYENKQE